MTGALLGLLLGVGLLLVWRSGPRSPQRRERPRKLSRRQQQLAAAGLPGMCTLHANSAREAITKVCTLPLLAGENIGHAFVVPTVAASVDLVVHVGSDPDGRRRVREVVAVPGRAEDGVIELADVFTTRDGRLVRGSGYPPHPERFAASGFDLPALLDDARWRS